MNGLTRESCDEIGFVWSCLLNQAISLDEVKRWCYLVIQRDEDYPEYILDMIDFEGTNFHLLKVIGFSPISPFINDAEYALIGIALKRGVAIYDSPISKNEALCKVDEYPEVEKMFRETFPFIDI